MAIIQMWPQNRGLRNSISFSGRSYSSVPGVTIPVPDFDVAVLQANGWTTYSTAAGKTTITMLPPANAVHNQLTLNGRTYATTPGVSIEVQPFDAPVLPQRLTRSPPKANGTASFAGDSNNAPLPAHQRLASKAATPKDPLPPRASPTGWRKATLCLQ